MTDYQTIIDRYYPVGSRLRDIYMKHCGAVADKALAIARRNNLTLPEEQIEAAAMLHDIGIFLTDAPGIECHGVEPYIAHGVLGYILLLNDGVDEAIASVALRHTGSGLTAEEIVSARLPLPPADYCPRTLLERLICYADKFYSKSGDMQCKPFERVRSSMQRFGSDSLKRFDALAAEFGK
ncbi:MAG: HD domain-containing protein [Bacteroides sp.]|nr:HD domain-containing protein [Bacteroides sp.]MCM1413225.1 HD domain-containing protein [Bacteroides sp.]MCM1471465.1 HD domain-containing protein [Bacteroides sp.]